MADMKHTIEMCLCNVCSGAGKIATNVVRSVDRQSGYVQLYKPCDHCIGSGRIVNVNIIKSFPFDPNEGEVDFELIKKKANR